MVYPEDFSGQLNVSSRQSGVTSSVTGNENHQVSSKQSLVQKNKSYKFYNFCFKHLMKTNTQRNMKLSFLMLCCYEMLRCLTVILYF